MLRHRSYPNFPQIDYEFQKFLLLKIRAYCYLKGRSFKHPRFQFSTNLSPPSFTRFTFTLRFASVYANIRGQITIIRPRTPPTPIHESSKTSRRDNGLTLPRCGWWSKWTARFFTEPLRRGLIFRVHDAPPNIYIYIYSLIYSLHRPIDNFHVELIEHRWARIGRNLLYQRPCWILKTKFEGERKWHNLDNRVDWREGRRRRGKRVVQEVTAEGVVRGKKEGGGTEARGGGGGGGGRHVALHESRHGGWFRGSEVV